MQAVAPRLPPFLALLAAFCIAAEQMAAGDGMSSSQTTSGGCATCLGRDTTDQRLDKAYRRVAERLWAWYNRWLIELDGRADCPLLLP